MAQILRRHVLAEKGKFLRRDFRQHERVAVRLQLGAQLEKGNAKEKQAKERVSVVYSKMKCELPLLRSAPRSEAD